MSSKPDRDARVKLTRAAVGSWLVASWAYFGWVVWEGLRGAR